MIAPRNAAAIASLVVLCGSMACTNFYEIPIETPIQPKMDVSAFNRVLVAGFIGGGTEDVDANLETVRLLRSQLRSKSNLRVIEAEVLPLVEMARDQLKPAATEGTAAVGADAPAPVPPLPAPAAAQEQDPRVRGEKDLERYQGIFADVAFWKKIGEEYQNPLIVTGTVLFTPYQSNAFVTRNVESYDSLGRRIVIPQRTYMERRGFILSPNFIFIDGRTGAQLHSEKMREEILYTAQQNVPALSSYFELMDRMIPAFLSTLSTQRIRGTRVLLK
ncbi:MAG: hypothetical protein WBC51_24750 [Vicinamibacterales bacterium]